MAPQVLRVARELRLRGAAFSAALTLALGGAMWNWVVRPAEEEHLLGHCGDEYKRYRREVRCWVPRLRPYIGVADTPAG